MARSLRISQIERYALSAYRLKRPGSIIVSARQGHFSQPGKNSLSLKQLAGLGKMPLPGLHYVWGVTETMIKTQRPLRLMGDMKP